MELQPFDRTDWDCFSGAEGNNPLIAWPQSGNADVVIVDDNGIGVSFDRHMHASKYGNADNWYNLTVNRKMAEHIAKGFDAELLTPEYLLNLGFEQVV